MEIPLAHDTRTLSKIIGQDAGEIQKFATQTPLIRLPWLDTPDRKVWAKLECNQLTNSFKVRGAYNAIRKLDPSVPVVTASAGNHGLAIAYVADKLGRKSKIFVPANASELKLRRLINMGAEVVPVGRDLYESTQIAQKVASEVGGTFISPFSHPDVIIGQGSIAVEVMQQSGLRFDDVLVPLGGGGLLAGVGAVFKDRQPDSRIIGLHPKAFQRDLSGDFFTGLSKPVYPTIADGLAVQHSDADLTAPLVQSLTDKIEHVPEHDIELGVVAMLHNEGLLVEGAGAIGIAALINDPDAAIYRGNVLVMVCGGNISTSSLMQALAAHTDDEKLAKLLGHRSVQLPMEAVRFKAAAKESTTEKADITHGGGNHNIWPELLDNLEEDTHKFVDDLKRHKEYLADQGLDNDPKIVEYLEKQLNATDEMLAYCRQNETAPWQVRDAYRVLIQNYSYLRNSLAWCSASSDQSRKVMFFDPAENNSSAVNYDRYGSILLREREFGLLQALGYDPEKVDLLLTSSGQAAYSVIESYLLREGLPPNPTVVASPYIYFEALEQINSLKNVNFLQSSSWNLKDIVNLVEVSNADALMIDPLANLGTLHVTDFRELAKLLDDKDWSKKWLVVDGTMVSGGVNLFDIFDKPNHPRVLYYESGSKYLQFGLDLQMAGVVISERELSPELARHRRNTGSVMYQSAVTRFPRYDRSQFLSRMRRLSSNADIMRSELTAFDPEGSKIEVAYPAMWKEMGWAHGGGVVSVMMKDEGLNNRACLDFLIDRIMVECRKDNLALTKGVSFGFSTTRLSAAAAMADDMPPFLRFSIGEESPDDMRKLGQAVTRSLEFFFQTYSPATEPTQANVQPRIGLTCSL
jgi:threonine dehydratase/cystathionine beta-lyase/cystathionine gamma-synthase